MRKAISFFANPKNQGFDCFCPAFFSLKPRNFTFLPQKGVPAAFGIAAGTVDTYLFDKRRERCYDYPNIYGKE